MSAATRIALLIHAPRDRVYHALIDRDDVATWMVPDGMTSHVHAFDAREGGTFRITLTYDAPTDTGKTSAQTDTYHGHFVSLVEGERVVQAIEFETEDPGMRGEMRVMINLRTVEGGTELVAVHDHLPPALSPADNELGWRISLGKLKQLVESRN